MGARTDATVPRGSRTTRHLVELPVVEVADGFLVQHQLLFGVFHGELFKAWLVPRQVLDLPMKLAAVSA